MYNRHPVSLSNHASVADFSSHKDTDSVTKDSIHGAGKYIVRFNNTVSLTHTVKMTPLLISIPHCFPNIVSGSNTIRIVVRENDTYSVLKEEVVKEDWYSNDELVSYLNSLFNFVKTDGTTAPLLTWGLDNGRFSLDFNYTLPEIQDQGGVDAVYLETSENFIDLLGFYHEVFEDRLPGWRTMRLSVGDPRLLGALKTPGGDLPVGHSLHVFTQHDLSMYTIPNLSGIDKIYICMEGATNNTMITPHGNLNVLACVDMSNTPYGQTATFNVSDIFSHGVDFREEKNITDCTIRLLDQHYNQLSIPHSLDVTCIVKVFHNDLKYT